MRRSETTSAKDSSDCGDIFRSRTRPNEIHTRSEPSHRRYRPAVRALVEPPTADHAADPLLSAFHLPRLPGPMPLPPHLLGVYAPGHSETWRAQGGMARGSADREVPPVSSGRVRSGP